MSSNQNVFLGNITKPIVLKTFLTITAISALAFVGINLIGLNSAVRVNGETISINDFNKNVSAQRKYQEEFQKVSFTGTEGENKLKSLKSEVLDQMIEDVVALQELKKLGAEVSSQDIDKEFENMAKANNGESKLDELASKYYGFSREEFKKYNVKPKLVKQKLQEKVQNSDEINKSAKSLADDVLKKLKAGEKFEDLAGKYSEDATSNQKGGDLDWVSKGSQVAEFENQMFALGVGETSGVFKTYQGYHIIKVTEKKSDKVHVYQILIKMQSFTDWLNSKVKSASVKKYVKI